MWCWKAPSWNTMSSCAGLRVWASRACHMIHLFISIYAMAKIKVKTNRAAHLGKGFHGHCPKHFTRLWEADWRMFNATDDRCKTQWPQTPINSLQLASTLVRTVTPRWQQARALVVTVLNDVTLKDLLKKSSFALLKITVRQLPGYRLFSGSHVRRGCSLLFLGLDV